MVAGKASGIKVAIDYAILTVDTCVVGGESVAESDVLVHALRLGEWVAATIAPASTDFPLILFAQTDGGEEVDGVSAVVVGCIGLDFVGADYPAERVCGPEVEPVDVVAEAEVDTISHAFFDNVVGEQILGFLVNATNAIGLVAGVEHLVAVGIEELAEILEVYLSVGGEVVCEVVFGTEDEVLSVLNAVANRSAKEGGGLGKGRHSSEDSVEKVDNVVVGSGVDEDLAVESPGHLESKTVVKVVFGR